MAGLRAAHVGVSGRGLGHIRGRPRHRGEPVHRPRALAGSAVCRVAHEMGIKISFGGAAGSALAAFQG